MHRNLTRIFRQSSFQHLYLVFWGFKVGTAQCRTFVRHKHKSLCRATIWILWLGVDINCEAFNAARVIILECVENGSILGLFDGMKDNIEREREKKPKGKEIISWNDARGKRMNVKGRKERIDEDGEGERDSEQEGTEWTGTRSQALAGSCFLS